MIRAPEPHDTFGAGMNSSPNTGPKAIPNFAIHHPQSSTDYTSSWSRTIFIHISKVLPLQTLGYIMDISCKTDIITETHASDADTSCWHQFCAVRQSRD
ncbi:hypothetical protein CDAR_620721 [Caerostris darwini]|uniref:Uncharacterized protein n=1 Tax=Caerostris darwini TaxID=1538125 RepID=A0AAV4URC1_9ARAC|nr:hypothetical protein CDAR_620721 [Caerostris darwini]